VVRVRRRAPVPAPRRCAAGRHGPVGADAASRSHPTGSRGPRVAQVDQHRGDDQQVQREPVRRWRPSSTTWDGASRCVPLCEPRCRCETR
jgi:hypothetical protein